MAAFMVLLAHLKFTFLPRISEEFLEYLDDHLGYVAARLVHAPLNALINGELAVYIFWFMSAYVISIKLFRDGSHVELLRSVSKRYFRLMIPALASAVLGYLLLASGAMHHLAFADQLGEEGAWGRQFYQFEPNFLLALRSGGWDAFFDFSFYETYNPSLWTMRAELYGSFFCFGVFAVLGRYQRRWIIYILLTIWATLRQDFPLVSFFLGFALSDFDYSPGHGRFNNPRWKSKWFYWLVFATALAIGGRPNHTGFLYVLASAAMTLSLLRSHVLQGLFSTRLMVWLGRLSFGLYLLHLPIIFSFSTSFHLAYGQHANWGLLVTFFLTIAVTIYAAYLFTIFVDEPVVRLLNRWSKKYISKDPMMT